MSGPRGHPGHEEHEDGQQSLHWSCDIMNACNYFFDYFLRHYERSPREATEADEARHVLAGLGELVPR